MSLFTTSLNSGSSGNCYYIGNENEAVLIDAGISCREIETRMKRLKLDIQKVKGVFISHEHSDHISGLTVLAQKYQLPVYITPPTMLFSRLKIEKHLLFSFNKLEPITIGNLSITPFPKFHDAADPYSFIVGCNGIKVGVFTDIGTPCKNVISHFKQCHAAFLESNYDDTMLDQGRYPYFLKMRIRGGNGHLSNEQALRLFKEHRPSFMSHLFLSHLSKNNNCPDLVFKLFHQQSTGVQMIVASRYGETAVYHIQHPFQKLTIPQPRRTTSSQLTFSFA